MKQMRYVVIAASLGAVMCVAGLSGCKQDLGVDRVFYECGSGSACGTGYACGEHPDHGRVCLPIGADVGQIDGGQTDGGQIQSPTLIIEPNGASGQSLMSASVTLIPESIDPALPSCSERMQRRTNAAPQAISQAADIEGGDLPTFTFQELDANESYTAFVEGLSDEGVRRAFGCEQGLDPTLNGRTVALDMQAQETLFADNYSVELTTSFENYDWLREYVRSLVRLPTHFAVAALGCDSSTDQAFCDQDPTDRGLLDLWLLDVSSKHPDMTPALEKYRRGGEFREVFRREFIDSFDTTASVTVNDGLYNDAEGLAQRKVRAELSWSRTDSGSLKGVVISPLSEFYFVNNFVFDDFELSDGQVSLIDVTATILPIKAIAQIFDQQFYDTHVSNYASGGEFAQLLPSQFVNCSNVAHSVEHNVSDTYNFAFQLCEYLGDEFLDNVWEFSTYVGSTEPQKSRVNASCDIREPDSYLDARWWQQLDYQPLPIYEHIEGSACHMVWRSKLPDQSTATITVKMSATVVQTPEGGE